MSEDGVKKSSNPWVALTAGCISGAVECLAVWPMENIKTQLQLQPANGKQPPFTGVYSGLVYTVRTTGFKSLYNGLTVTLVGSIPKAGIRFSANSYCKQLLSDGKGGKLNMAQQFLAGMGAGTVEAIIAVTPIETVKTKLIQSNQGMIDGVKTIVRESGFRGLYQGLVATILKQSSNQGLRFMFFNKYKDIVTNDGKSPLPPFLALLGGMGAGCFSVLGNNPVDVVKTRMQGKDAHLYSSTWDCFVKIVKNESIRGLYKGTLARMGRVVPGQGVIFMSFESIQLWVENTMFSAKEK